MEISRADHLQWCKDRALKYVQQEDWNRAIESMMSDLGKHPETKLTPAEQQVLLTPILFMQTEEQKLIEWINGFN